MFKILLTLSVVLFTFTSNAQERIEFGIGAGSSLPVNGSAFKSAASAGDSYSYWLGYGLDENLSVEIGLDQFDFDSVNSKHKALILGGIYRFVPENTLHPIAKFGLASVESTSLNDLKTNSLGAKAAAGLELDYKCISVGVLFNLHHISKTDDLADYKNTQALLPALFLTLHNDFGDSNNSPTQSKSTAPAAPLAPETEKASVRLNMVFATGKSELSSKNDSEIEKLANFMKKFNTTSIEIAGHSDNIGDSKSNKLLSQKRAEAIKAALLKIGIDSSRLKTKGYGSSQPIADNKTETGREQNRRVTAEISTMTTKTR